MGLCLVFSISLFVFGDLEACIVVVSMFVFVWSVFTDTGALGPQIQLIILICLLYSLIYNRLQSSCECMLFFFPLLVLEGYWIYVFAL